LAQTRPAGQRLLERAAAATLPEMHTLSAEAARRLFRESHSRLDGPRLIIRMGPRSPWKTWSRPRRR